MQRISTPTREVDKFGLGKDGFKAGGPPNATQLESSWFDNVQEELANVVEGQGVALDGLVLNQLKQVLDNYSFVSPTINGILTIAAGGTFQCDAGSTVNLDTTLTCNSDVVLGDSAADAVIIPGSTTHVGPAYFTDPIEIYDTVLLDGVTSVTAAFNILGASGGSLSCDPTAVCQWNGTMELIGRVRILSGTSVAEGDLSKDGSGNFQYRNASGTRKVHVSQDGWVKGYGQLNTSALAAVVQLDTDSSVAPIVTADLDVSAEFWVQRAVAGDIIVSLIEVGGIGQISTNQTVRCAATGGSTWERYTFSRERASADTTPRTYRLEVDANGSLVACRNLRITVEPTR